MRIVVVCGGVSSERSVSMSSGLTVTKALIAAHHDVVVLDPAQQPSVLIGGSGSGTDHLFDLEIQAELPGSGVGRCGASFLDSLMAPDVWDQLRGADIVFVALHGGWGEDGHVQALFEMAGIPFTGASSVACNFSYRKSRSLQLLKAAGVPTPEHVVWESQVRSVPADAIAMVNRGPVVVKPDTEGSSVGAHLVDNAVQIESIKNNTADLVIGPYLPGREFTVGVIGDTVLPPVEINNIRALFDYQSKYRREVSCQCPAPVDDALNERLKKYALSAHQALAFDSTMYSRIDFRCDADENPFVLEVNALPGLSPVSLLPLAAMQLGWSYLELIESLINLKLSSIRRCRSVSASSG
ncbi:ATP-grasp domain-containing protein [Nocardia terpenica]|uniref:D-alanine--D-alanine ligase family protein n=1 Tax=Nocardia terpenica TaxID=455432 RepID=UPI0009EF06F6|nr:ATP-grasp domain-containing protein [Nocardia terpenica]NQE85994.1 ATP-grasp domain-containing protein [Nocardia terpenica]